MKRLLAAAMTAAIMVTLPSYADCRTSLPFGTLSVGSVGTYCYRSPCAWRAIVGSSSAERPLWTNSVLPSFAASPADARRISTAWDKFDCLLVDGRFDGVTLTLAKILGSC
jgi:hypothetical protein